MDYIDFSRIDGLHTDFQRTVSRVIKDLFPTVRLVKLDGVYPGFNPKTPFALIDEPHLLPPYVIRTMAESEVDERLVAWLIDNNTNDPNSKANRLHLLEMATAAVNAKREVELMEERKDMLKSVMGSKKHVYKHDGKILRK